MEVENLQKALAFYLGECDEYHPVELEYRLLTNIPAEKRTVDQTERLIYLAKAMSDASDASNRAFREALDRHIVA